MPHRSSPEHFVAPQHQAASTIRTIGPVPRRAVVHSIKRAARNLDVLVGVNVMEITVVVAVGLLATALGIVLGRYVWPARQGIEPGLLTNAARLDQECSGLRSRVVQLDLDSKAFAAEAKKAGEEAARLSERMTAQTIHLGDQTEHISALEVHLNNSAGEAKTLAAEVAVLKERETSLTQKIAAQAVQLA